MSIHNKFSMATPPPSTSSTALQATPLTIYAGTLSLLSAITVTTVFYLLIGLQGAIVTLALYVVALAGIVCWKRVVETVCYPRYVNLSERRRNEVDEVRVRAIKRLLEGVTLILKQEHLIQKSMSKEKSESSVTSATVDSSASSSSSESMLERHFTSSSSSSSLLECTEQDEENHHDIEMGQHQNDNDVLTNNAHLHDDDDNDDDDNLPSSCCGEHDVENNHRDNDISVIVQLYKTEDEETTTASSSSSVGTDSAETEYTHVRIPCPGMMMQCPSRSSSSSSSSDANADASSSPLASKENNNIIMSTTTTTTTTTTPPRTRAASKNCPICLSTYEPHDSICYSSNSECTHVFHCECIIRWFVEMGRQNNAIVIRHGTKLLDESALLDYTLSCPCCRQPFVTQNDISNKKGVIDTEEEEKNGVASDKMENEMTSKVTVSRSTSSFLSCKVLPVKETEEDDQECPV